jgi:hypothetical protein
VLFLMSEVPLYNDAASADSSAEIPLEISIQAQGVASEGTCPDFQSKSGATEVVRA